MPCCLQYFACDGEYWHVGFSFSGNSMRCLLEECPASRTGGAQLCQWMCWSVLSSALRGPWPMAGWFWKLLEISNDWCQNLKQTRGCVNVGGIESTCFCLLLRKTIAWTMHFALMYCSSGVRKCRYLPVTVPVLEIQTESLICLNFLHPLLFAFSGQLF